MEAEREVEAPARPPSPAGGRRTRPDNTPPNRGRAGASRSPAGGPTAAQLAKAPRRGIPAPRRSTTASIPAVANTSSRSHSLRDFGPSPRNRGTPPTAGARRPRQSDRPRIAPRPRFPGSGGPSAVPPSTPERKSWSLDQKVPMHHIRSLLRRTPSRDAGAREPRSGLTESFIPSRPLPPRNPHYPTP